MDVTVLLGPSGVNFSSGARRTLLLCFKLNATIVRHLQCIKPDTTGAITLQFVSPLVAKIVVDNVEYELQLADINATVGMMMSNASK